MTQGVAAGRSGEDLKLMGDWVSENYLRYFDMTLDRWVNNIVKFMDATHIQ